MDTNTSQSDSVLNLKCNQCGASLILIEEKVIDLVNNFSDLKVTTYKCSNTACQEEIDKKKAKQAEIRLMQKLAKENKLKNHAPLTKS